jgi:PleD family two-component response regulator
MEIVSKRKDVTTDTGSRPGSADAAAPADALQPDKIVTVLSISPAEEDHVNLRNILSHSNWQLRCVRSWREAKAFLAERLMPVVICESELPDARWNEVLTELSHVPNSPALVVTSRLADDFLWAEVLNLGGYDVLMKPFEASEVFRVVSLAWLNWKSRRDRVRAASPASGRFAAAVSF